MTVLAAIVTIDSHTVISNPWSMRVRSPVS
jgi:hypothetical protein